MKKNITLFYWYRLTKFALFHISILVLFYRERGLSFSQIMLLQSVYYFAKVFSEVPTGALADRWGRKTSLVIGSFLHSLSYLLIFFSHTLPLFLLWEALAGIAMSFASGADSALAYDTLKNLKKENLYQKIEGNAYSLRLLAFAIFAPAGSLLATFNLALPYLASSIIIFLSGFVALAFVEVKADQASFQTMVTSDLLEPTFSQRYYRQIKESIKEVFGKRKVFWLVLFFSLIFLATRLGFWTYQPYMEEIGLPLSLFGVVLACFHLFSALVSKYADRIEGLLKENLVLLVMPLLLIIAFVLMSRFLSLGGLFFIYLQTIVWGLNEPIIKNYTNRLISSGNRATILSIQSMGGNLVFAFVAPFLGILVDKFSLPYALLLFAVVIFALTLVLWWYKIRCYRE